MPGVDVAPFYVMEMVKAAGAREAAGAEVLHLEVGQPSTPAPALALTAVREALASGATLGYTEVKGMAALRARLAAHYASWYGLEVDPERILLTMGSSAGFVIAFLTLFDRGARVAVPEPGYPCYRNVMLALGSSRCRFGPTPRPGSSSPRRSRRRRASRRRAGRQPQQPHRHGAGSGRVGSGGGLVRRARVCR